MLEFCVVNIVLPCLLFEFFPHAEHVVALLSMALVGSVEQRLLSRANALPSDVESIHNMVYHFTVGDSQYSAGGIVPLPCITQVV